MKIGKVSESILKRSVLKQVKQKNDEIKCGAAIGVDCAVFTSDSTDFMTVCVQAGTLICTEDMVRYIHKVANNLACAGASLYGVLLTLCLPERTREIEIKQIMEVAKQTSDALGMQIMGGHTTLSTVAKVPTVSVTGLGKLKKEDAILPGKIHPGQDIVISKWIALEGTWLIASQRKEELLSKYPSHLVDAAIHYKNSISTLKEAATAIRSNVSAMHDISEGGVFAALWELAEGADVGLTIDLKKIPIKQESVEICEFFHINPYELMSGGSLIMIVDNGYDLVRQLEEEQIPAVVVGKITDSNDRIILNDDERRFLDRPKADEIYKVLDL